MRQKKTSLKSTTSNRNEESTQKKLSYLMHVSNDTNRMIVYTLLLNMFYRFPEFLLYFYLVFGFNFPKGKDIEIFSFNLLCFNMFCNLMASLVEFIYLLSYSFYILFYFKYNKTVRIGFWTVFNKKPKQ